MGLLDDAKKHQSSKQLGNKRCSMCSLADPETTELRPKSDAVELAEAFTDKSLSSSTLAQVLRARGAKVTPSTVQRHRNEHVAGWSNR